jgi:hypothetical protein
LKIAEVAYLRNNGRGAGKTFVRSYRRSEGKMMILENLRNKQSPFREFSRTARALGCGVWRSGGISQHVWPAESSKLAKELISFPVA